MIKVDLHTHSMDSPDGGLDEDDYWSMLIQEKIDVFAVTDHGSINFALKLKSQPRFENSVIVGQEIKSTEGEIIGLFLQHRIPDGHSAQKTIKEIQNQGGAVVIPHPMDPFRSGISLEVIKELKGVDAVELYNGRSLLQSSQMKKLKAWAKKNDIACIAASDAHSVSGMGRTFTRLPAFPDSPKNLKSMFEGEIRIQYRRPPIRAYFAPKLNWLRHKVFPS